MTSMFTGKVKNLREVASRRCRFRAGAKKNFLGDLDHLVKEPWVVATRTDSVGR